MSDFEKMMEHLSARRQIERALRQRRNANLPPWERGRQDLYQQLQQQQQLATISTEVLNADAMALTIVCGGFANVGWGLTGTWVGTAYFETANTGNPNVWYPDSVQPFASGTAVASATANGNFWTPVSPNQYLKRVRFSRTSGSITVIGAAAYDSSYQDAFLTSAQRFVTSSATSGTNTLTQAANTNRAWNLTSLEVCFASPGQPGGAGRVSIYDGTVTGNLMFEEFIQQPSVGGSVGWKQVINLPTNSAGIQSLVNTPGNATTIVVRGINGSSIVNAAFTAN